MPARKTRTIKQHRFALPKYLKNLLDVELGPERGKAKPTFTWEDPPCPACGSADTALLRDPGATGRASRPRWHVCRECACEFDPKRGVALVFDEEARPYLVSGGERRPLSAKQYGRVAC